MKSQDKRRTRSRLTHLAFCLIPLWVSCKTRPALVLQTVGPPTAAVSLGRLDSSGDGFLKVFSATGIRHVGSQSKYYPHTDYMIYNTNGSVFQWVENSLGPMDEAPSLVELPTGPYKIRAQDDDYGRVIVPLFIEPWRTTKVYLDARTIDSLEHLNSSNFVCLPNGRIVGWRARGQEPKVDHAKH
jgi:hypothetical protein